jgi:peptidyl-dipeptidase Dcp
MSRFVSVSAVVLLMVAPGCSRQPESESDLVVSDLNNVADVELDNPFLRPSSLLMGFPRFDLVRPEHYLPAFELGMGEQLAEVEAIVTQEAPPSVDNTLLPLERSGRMLRRVNSVFSAMVSANTNDEISAIQSAIAPRLSAHTDNIHLDSRLFDRLDQLYQQRNALDVDPETLRLLEETRRVFIRAGAQLSEQDKSRLREINTELAQLQTRFTQNVLNEVNQLAIEVQSRDQLAGLSDAEIQAAAEMAERRGKSGYLLPLINTSGQPVLASLQDRELRRRIHQISLSRGHRGGEYDNREIVTRTARLRAERAQLLGYQSHAHFVLENQTAQTLTAVKGRLADLIAPAVANARREAADLQTMIDAEGGDFELQSWDWAYYAEKVREARYEFDANQLKPYFELESVLRNGVFYAATQLYGITFTERPDLPVYHEDVRVFEVIDQDGASLGLFIFDPYARPSKRGGAWMNAYISQSHLLGDRPIVGNHLNITKPAEGEPTLLTFTQVNTAFHEFGHALHGLFSDVMYPTFAGTRVPRDFVEYPSQVNEMWAVWPEVLANYARHYETGEPMPSALLEKVLAAQAFNQGFATTEYLAAALIDMALHELTSVQIPSAESLMQFEAEVLAAAGADFAPVPPRYRYSYFSHIMGGYSAGYYSYIWSEVLDADTVEWFHENGGLTRANGDTFRSAILSKGGSVDAMQMYQAFRSRDADVRYLLERRGLKANTAD